MRKVKFFAVCLTVIIALAIFAACDPKTDASGDTDLSAGDGEGTTAFDLLSKEDIAHIVGYCATFTQNKGTSVWWEYRYFGYILDESPERCLELSVIPDDGTDEIQHQRVDFMYVFKNNAAAEKFAEISRQKALEDDDSKDMEFLVDGNHMYQTTYLYDDKTHEIIGDVTPEEQKKFYTETVKKATLPTTFSKTRFDFIIESMTNQFYVSLDLSIANEFEYDDYNGVHQIETYENYECLAITYPGSLAEFSSADLSKAYQREYLYWSNGESPADFAVSDIEEHLEEIRQNGNTKDNYIDNERETGYTFACYKDKMQG